MVGQHAAGLEQAEGGAPDQGAVRDAQRAGHATSNGAAGQTDASVDETLGTFAIAQSGDGHAAHGGAGQSPTNEATHATLGHTGSEQRSESAVDSAFHERFTVGSGRLEALLGRLGVLRGLGLVLRQPLSDRCVGLAIGLDKHGLILAAAGEDDFACL